MPGVRFTLLCDGSSDRALVPILEWLLRQHFAGVAVSIDWADFRRLREPPRGLADRIRQALELYPCDVLFVHRDAETEDRPHRSAEITRAIETLGGLELPHICVIPIRMTEAWLLIDEASIRAASGNPNGHVALDLPRLRDIEEIPDPKRLLYELLCQASELTGRRQRRFRPDRCVQLVAQRIGDFSDLRRLSAFVELEEEVLGTAADIEPDC